MIALIVVLVIAAILVTMVIGAHNRLVGLRRSADNAFADIDARLKQRQALIPDLVETVKGYAAHESGRLDEVIAARAAAASAGGVEGKVAAENVLSGALGRLFAAAQSHPDLIADRDFLKLRDQLDDIETNTAAARRFFNHAVLEFNAQARSFPNLLFAASLGFTQRDLFDLGEGGAAVHTSPPVKF